MTAWPVNPIDPNPKLKALNLSMSLNPYGTLKVWIMIEVVGRGPARVLSFLKGRSLISLFKSAARSVTLSAPFKVTIKAKIGISNYFILLMFTCLII